MPRNEDDQPPAGALPEMGKIVEGRLSRGWKLGAALAGALGRSAGRRLLASNEATAGETAVRLASTLGEMKGLSMKLGQMLSYVDAQVPDGWRQALTVLQHRSAAMPKDAVFRVVEEDLGRPPDLLFAAWDEKPFAAASIGQVHRARLRNGAEVAVKVRYPSIEKVVQHDLDNAALLRHFGALLMPELETEELMSELSERVLEECDYEKEAENQSSFRHFFRGEEGIVVPEVYRDHSSRRVLTSEWIDGVQFNDFVRTASESERNRAARSVHSFAFRSIFRMGALNCDPHPGNYLFLPGRVAFLDFGCVRRFSDELQRTWKAMVKSALDRDLDAFRAAVVRIGFADDTSAFDFDAHYGQYLHLLHPWLTDRGAALNRELVASSYSALLLANPNRARLKMPRELLFANRLQWGLYSVLAELGATCPFRPEILDILYEPGEPRPAPFSDEELQRYLRPRA